MRRLHAVMSDPQTPSTPGIRPFPSTDGRAYKSACMHDLRDHINCYIPRTESENLSSVELVAGQGAHISHIAINLTSILLSKCGIKWINAGHNYVTDGANLIVFKSNSLCYYVTVPILFRSNSLCTKSAVLKVSSNTFTFYCFTSESLFWFYSFSI